MQSFSVAHSILKLCASCAILCFAFAAQAADYDREQRLSQEAEAGLFTGDAIYLQASGRDFLVIETASELDHSSGTVVLLHGRGLQPDAAQVVGPLRTSLSAQGWHTFSLQMPVLEKSAKYYDYVSIFPEAVARINAGIEYAAQQTTKPVVLVAHSCGVHMAMDWIRKHSDREIAAFIGIGMGATDYQQPMQEAFPLNKMSVPVLDIFGQNDYPAVLRQAPSRWSAIQESGVSNSFQQVITDADHNYVDKDDALLAGITTWLAQIFPEN